MVLFQVRLTNPLMDPWSWDEEWGTVNFGSAGPSEGVVPMCLDIGVMGGVTATNDQHAVSVFGHSAFTCDMYNCHPWSPHQVILLVEVKPFCHHYFLWLKMLS